MPKIQKIKPTKITLSLTKESIKALRDRAAREQTTISALIRRFALGLAVLLLVACGGETFSTGAPDGAAGMASTGGSGGSGGTPAVAPSCGESNGR